MINRTGFIATVIKRLALISMLIIVSHAHKSYAEMTETQIKDAIASQTTGRMPGARISSVACTPYASPLLDIYETEVEDNYYPKRSCSGQNITREDFAVQIAFDPTYGGNEPLEIVVPGQLQLPDDVTTIYDAQGNLICDNSDSGKLCNEDDFTHTGSGDDVLYNGNTVYSSINMLTYPLEGYVYDYTYNSESGQYSEAVIQLYTSECNNSTPGYDAGHREGEEIKYVSGKTVYDKNCQISKDVCGNNIVSGEVMYVDLNADGVCEPQTTLGSKIKSTRGNSSTETGQGSLFLTRFANDFASDVSKKNIMDLDPAEVKVWIKEGEIVYPHEVALTSFWVEFEGPYACVYSSSKTPDVKWRVEDKYPVTMAEVLDLYELELETTTAYAPLTSFTMDHCVLIPDSEMGPREILNFGSLISDVCTDYDTSSSMWVKPFTGIVVECIEETLMNIFIPSTETLNGVEVTSNDSFFIQMQYNMKGIIKALLVLYIIFFGYRLLVVSKVPDRSEWMWLGLKAAMVIYFAIGTGMIDLFPKLTAVSKYFSLIVMEAGLGEYDEDREPYALEVYNARLAYTNTSNIDQINSDIVATESKLANLEQELIDKQLEYDEALISKDELCKDVDDLEAYKNEKSASLEEVKNEVALLEQEYKDSINGITQVLSNASSAIDNFADYVEQYYKNRYDASVALAALKEAEDTMNAAQEEMDLASQPISLSQSSFNAVTTTSDARGFKRSSITLDNMEAGVSYKITYTYDSVISCCNTPDYLVQVNFNIRNTAGYTALASYFLTERIVKEESFIVTGTGNDTIQIVAGPLSQGQITNIVITPVLEDQTADYEAAVSVYNDALAAYNAFDAAQTGALSQLESDYNDYIAANPGGNFVSDVTEQEYINAQEISKNASTAVYYFGTMSYLDISTWLNEAAASISNQSEIDSLESLTKSVVSSIQTDFSYLQNEISNLGLSNSEIQALIDTTSSSLDNAIVDIEAAKSAAQTAASSLCITGGTCYLGLTYTDAAGNDVIIEEGGEYPYSSLSSANDEYTEAYNAWVVAQDACTLAGDIIYKVDDDSQTATGITKDIEDITAEKNILEDELADLQADAANSELSIEEAQERLDQAYAELDLYDESISETDAYTGYNYCDFRYIYDYPEGKEYMKLWDTIDCKISKYLGIGDNEYSQTTPQTLWLGFISLISTDDTKGGTALGIPLFLLTLIVTMVILIVVFRIVHIYILAFMNLVMLVYISPLIIPAALFNYTKDIFESWLKQIIANIMQPVLLFAFVSFMFAVMDISFFGENKRFVISDYSDVAFDDDGNVYGGIPYQIAREDGADTIDDAVSESSDVSKPSDKPTDKEVNEAVTEESEEEVTSQAVEPEHCSDAKALGCMYQTADIYTEPLNLIDTQYDPEFEMILIKQGTDISEVLEQDESSDESSSEDSSSEDEAVTYRVNLSDGKDMDLLVGLLKMLLICFITTSLLKSVEEFTAKAIGSINLSGGGAASQGALFGDKDGNVSGTGTIASFFAQQSIRTTSAFLNHTIKSAVFSSAKKDIKKKRDQLTGGSKESGGSKKLPLGSGDSRITRSSDKKAVTEGIIEE